MSGSLLSLGSTFLGVGAGFLSSLAYDVVAVYDQNFNQVFRDARPMKASIKEKAKYMRNPVETGSVITDHRIFEPIEIDLSVVLIPETYVATYQEIREIYLGLNSVSVQTKTGIYTDLFIESMPHEENPEHYDTITMVLKLTECVFVTPSTSALPKGNQNPSTTTEPTKEDVDKKTKGNSALFDIIHHQGWLGE